MHTLWQRLNNVFFFGVTALFALSVASALTTSWMYSTAAVHTLRVSTLQQFKPQGTDMRNGRMARVDRALLAFDLDADLSGAFNWNVKQLFVYLSATFQTPANVRALIREGRGGWLALRASAYCCHALAVFRRRMLGPAGWSPPPPPLPLPSPLLPTPPNPFPSRR